MVTCPVEELGGETRVPLNFKNLGDELRGDAAELVEILDEGWAPVMIVSTECVNNVTGDGGEVLGY